MKLNAVATACAFVCNGLTMNPRRQFLDHTFIMGGGRIEYALKKFTDGN